MEKIKRLLATDLDGTFVGDETGLKNLLTHYANLKEPVALAYITGRHRSSVAELIYEKFLPIPDLLITDVGTIIYAGLHFLEDEEWKNKMLEKWNPEAILKIANNISGLIRQELPNDRRVSFHSTGASPAEELKEQLEKNNVPHTFVFSSDRDVDILPPGSGKGKALEFLIKKYVEKDAHILVAGDSGNDLDMLLLDYPAVIVSNAHEELSEIEENKKLFRAKSSHANGILEAWHHFYGKEV